MDYSVAFETAIKALEKQVEKTPKKIGKQHYACPLCDSILNISYDGNARVYLIELRLVNNVSKFSRIDINNLSPKHSTILHVVLKNL